MTFSTRALILTLVFLLGLPALQFPSLFRQHLLAPLLLAPRSAYAAGGLVLGAFSALWALRIPTLNRLCRKLHHLAHRLTATALGLTRDLQRGGDCRRDLYSPPPSGVSAQTRAFFVYLAPYWLSPLWLLMFPTVGVLPLVGGPVSFAVGWILGLALMLPLVEIRPGQADFKAYGLPLTLGSSLWLWGAVAAASLAALGEGTPHAAIRVLWSGWISLFSFL